MIYLDNAATTKQTNGSINVANLYAGEKFFNSSAVYAAQNMLALEEAKEVILKKLKAKSASSLIFTGSATEANNMILNSISDNIIVSEGEHPSIYNMAMHLKQQGKNIKFCPLLQNGQINYEKLEELLDEKTKLVSIMHVCNETGAINNLKRIRQIVSSKSPRALFHSDGVQAFLKTNFSVSSLDVDFYTISAHKIGGPKGIGALYAKNKNKLKPLIFGGEQEYSLRGGTVNLPAVMAFKNVCEKRKPDLPHIQLLFNTLEEQFLDEGIVINFNQTSPYIMSTTFTGVNGETLVNMLKEKGVYVSRGSACSSKKAGNRVLESIGFSADKIKSVVRISFLEDLTQEEVKQAGEIINSAYKELKQRINIR